MTEDGPSDIKVVETVVWHRGKARRFTVEQIAKGEEKTYVESLRKK